MITTLKKVRHRATPYSRAATINIAYEYFMCFLVCCAAFVFSCPLTYAPVNAAAPISIADPIITGPPIVIGYVDMKPYMYTENGQPAGETIQLLRQIFKGLPYKYSMQEYPVKRLLQLISVGKVHIWPRIKGPPDFENQTYKSPHVILTLRLRLFSMTKTQLRNINSIHEAVITISGYTYMGLRAELEQRDTGIRFIDASNHITGLKMLRSKRARYLLDYAGASAFALQELRMEHVPSIPILDIPAYIYVSRKLPYAKALLRDLGQAFLEIKSNKHTPPLYN